MRKIFLSLVTLFFVHSPLVFGDASSLTPDQALLKLKDGNKRFVEGKVLHPQQGTDRRTELTKGQAPFATILGCSDSRVPPEVVFDQGLGDLFIVRTAGNTFDNLALGSIEYSVAVLGSTLILVLGHDQCGAVKATMEGKPLPGHIEDIAKRIAPGLKDRTCRIKDPLQCAIQANVEVIVAQLKDSSPILAPLVKAGKLKVVGGRYNLETGAVEMLP
ncbi:MAG: carbonic anhydrase [bacterium]